MGDDLAETGKGVFGPYKLESHSMIELPGSDVGELDFVVWYQLDVTDEKDTQKQYRFSIPRYEYSPTKLPLLSIEAMRIDLQERDGLSIAEYVKTGDLKPKLTTYPNSDTI